MDNKVGLITGATGNLGRVVAKALLESGAKVVASYRAEDKMAELVEFVGDLRGNLTGVKADVTNEENVRELVEQAIQKHGRIDILLNITGAYVGGSDVASTDLSIWDFMMNVNLKSTFLCCKTVLPFMIQQNFGRIVNVSSWVAVINSRRVKSGAYAVSKSGVKILTETIAEEVKKYDINVNCIIPSTIDTPDNRRNRPKADFSKWVQPKDIADVILFLVSEKSDIISGASVPVYGKAL